METFNSGSHLNGCTGWFKHLRVPFTKRKCICFSVAEFFGFSVSLTERFG
jgi:hypothetical protein